MNRIHDAFSEILGMLEYGHRSLSPYDIEHMYTGWNIICEGVCVGQKVRFWVCVFINLGLVF